MNPAWLFLIIPGTAIFTIAAGVGVIVYLASKSDSTHISD